MSFAIVVAIVVRQLIQLSANQFVESVSDIGHCHYVYVWSTIYTGEEATPDNSSASQWSDANELKTLH